MTTFQVDPDQLAPYLERDEPIRKLEFDGRICWLKQASPPHGQARYKALALFAGWLDIEILKPVPNPGGQESIAIEFQRLETLKATGVRVPEVLASGDRFLLLGDLGPDLRFRIKQSANITERLDWLRSALDGLLDLHRRRAYLSQAFPRNITVADDGEVGFLDFEDDPGLVFDLDQAQARDFLLLSMNTCHFFDEARPALVGLLAETLRQANPGARTHLLDAVEKLQGMRRLVGKRWLRSGLHKHHVMLECLTQAALPVDS